MPQNPSDDELIAFANKAGLSTEPSDAELLAFAGKQGLKKFESDVPIVNKVRGLLQEQFPNAFPEYVKESPEPINAVMPMEALPTQALGGDKLMGLIAKYGGKSSGLLDATGKAAETIPEHYEAMKQVGRKLYPYAKKAAIVGAGLLGAKSLMKLGH